MQENNSIENEGRHRASDVRTTRHRPVAWFGGRRAYLAAALAAVVGLGVTGVALANARPDGDRPNTTVAVDEQARAEAAQRADRSRREATSLPATPSASPTTEASPSPTATATKPAATKAATKAAPKKAAPAKPKPAWVHPMTGAATTSCYGMRWGVLHAGIDLAMPADTPIRAAGAGTVVTAGWAYPGYGISVVIDHGNGILTHYAHQSRTAVQVGNRVTAGQVIGYEGSTGDSTGPHLHFEVHNGLWSQLDPGPWMRARGVNLGC